MRIAIVTLCTPDVTYGEMPRGTLAVRYYLEAFGHHVLFIDRSLGMHPLRLLRTLRAWMPDVILAQHLVGAVVGLFRRARLLGCPVVHAWDDYYAEQAPLPKWSVWPLEMAAIRWADQITSVSPYNCHLARKWGKPCEYIPHGSHESRYPTALRLEAERIKVVYLGEQSAYKRTPQLIEAVRGIECDLFLVGVPDPDLRGRAPPNVHFVGPVPGEQIQAVLAQADILVNPSDQDSNFKVFDYVRAGKPILGVTGRMSWAFEHGKDAWLVDDLREGVIRLRDDAALRSRLVEGLKERPVLTWEQVVRKLEAVLLKVVRDQNSKERG